MRKIIEVTVLFAVIGILSATTTVKSALAVVYADVVVLLSNKKETGNGNPQLFHITTPTRLIQMNLTGASALDATVVVQGSLDAVDWATISTVNMSKASISSVFLNSTVPYTVMRANLSAISGVYGLSGASGIASAVAAGTQAKVNVMVAQ